MRGLSFGILAFGAFIFLAPPAAHAADTVGKVKEITGSATVTHASAAKPQDLKLGDAIAPQDVIETGDGARVDIIFVDNTDLVIAGRGKLTVDDFIYDTKKPDDGKAAFSILGAAFSYAGGLLDKLKTPHVTLNTDFGSIGIRGTSLYGAMAQGRSMIFLETGAVDVTNKGGTIALNPGFGTSLGSATEAPRPPYQWSADEIAWIKHEVSDPSLHNALMAMADTASPAKTIAGKVEAAGGGGAAMDKLARAERQEPASPAAPAEAGVAAGAVASNESARMASSSAPAAAVVAPAAPAAPAAAPAEAVAETKAKAVQPVTILALNSLSPGMLGTKFLKDATDKDALRVDTQWPVTLNLAVVDVAKLDLQDTVLTYTAQMKSEHLFGPAYLEMWLHFPDQTRDVFVNGRAQPMTGDAGWKQMQTSYTLKKGQIPERITLNLVVNGKGVVLVKDVKLVR